MQRGYNVRSHSRTSVHGGCAFRRNMRTTVIHNEAADSDGRHREAHSEHIFASRIVGALHCAPDGTVTAANDALLKMTGRTREDLVARRLDWRDLFNSAQTAIPPAAGLSFNAEMPEGASDAVQVEVIASGASGWTAIALDVSATFVAERALVRAREILEQRNDELSGAVSTAAERLNRSENALASATSRMDVAAAELKAERHRVEALAANLAAVSRELDAFSYSVSHDLRTPLRSIEGFSRVLSTHYASVLDERGLDYLQRVMKATRRMSQLLDDLLKLARTSRAPLTPVTVDITAGAQQIAAELQQLEPGRTVEWRIQPDLTALGDRTLLRVLFENLLTNAWKFTGRRTDSVIEVGTFDAGATRVYFVRDNGAGFDMAYADQLFGVFQRLHSAAEFEGTGVGLATVQRIVNRHGGEIWAEAAVDRGAAFYFTLGQGRPTDTRGGAAS
jgi:signal transduction histidine kinase